MKRSITARSAFVVVLCLISVSALAAPLNFQPRSKAMEPATERFDRGAWIMQMDRLNTKLQAEHVALGLARTVDVPVDAQILDEIMRGRSDERKLKVGVEGELSFEVSFRDLDLSSLPGRGLLRDVGAVRATANGGFVWTAAVRSPDAAALRVHITEMNFPEGSELYVWTRDGMAFGPYTDLGPNGNGEFWTNSVQGDEAILQIRYNGGDRPSFRVAGVGHITSKWPMAKTLNPMSDGTPACPDDNAHCVWDINCSAAGAGTEVAEARDAVAEMLFVSGAYYYICTGGMIADMDTSSVTPYFLTANHCISKGREANSLETFFDYVSPGCGQCGSFPTNAATAGATIVAGNRTSDYTLLLLSSTPSGVAYLGWDTTPVANNNGVGLYRVSHPQGAPQSYSEHVVDTSYGTCTSWPRGNWIYSRDTVGATEGGSSGSPVVIASGKIVGQLSGGCGTNISDNCDPDSNATVDGAFAAYFDQVAQYLDNGGGSGCTDADGDGYCTSEGDCDDGDATIYPGAPEVCDDGIDNDCDGQIDEGCGGTECTDADGDGYCAEIDDCDDNDPHVHPGHPDKGGRWGRDGKDNDCDGLKDNG